MNRTLYELYTSSTPEVRVRFTRRAREEFVTHAEVSMHMIECNPGHVCQDDN